MNRLECGFLPGTLHLLPLFTQSLQVCYIESDEFRMRFPVIFAVTVLKNLLDGILMGFLPTDKKFFWRWKIRHSGLIDVRAKSQLRVNGLFEGGFGGNGGFSGAQKIQFQGVSNKLIVLPVNQHPKIQVVHVSFHLA